ncbi:hypothetical protein [Mucilaginibacter paludis]|uniref:Uncharacterized protein n=1 Tax=Mucilaginibacter paludis DSM 18603 TaxID=714943 RepID=H1Y9V2_9SPHI|nr:hypothetical protein [Mucilaginibacter paludis]EHQ31135.1 hypothetical protein Mucpa_7092 [Mucilaginibacter paludis DSM 18603]
MTDKQTERYDNLLGLLLKPEGYSWLSYTKEDDELATTRDLIFLESQQLVTLVKTLKRIYSAHITDEGIAFINAGGFAGLGARVITDYLVAGVPSSTLSEPVSTKMLPKGYAMLFLLVLLLIATWTVVSNFLLSH